MRDSLRMVLVLTVIAMVSAAVLSQVYSFTSVIIAENQAREMEASVYEVLDNVAELAFLDADFVLFAAKDSSGNPVGFAYAAEANGYAGTVRVLVGVKDSSMAIADVVVLSHSETPGLGSRIEETSFRNQFQGKVASDAIVLNQDIDSIAGATVSARAVTEAVRKNFDAAVAVYEGGR